MLLFVLLALLAIAYWPITLVILAYLMVREIILAYGLRINFWFIRVNIAPYDRSAEETAPLTPEMRMKIEGYCKRTGQNPDDFRMLK